MSRPNEDDQSMSTDLRSDVSFMNRQMELRRLYREFRSAIETINNVSQIEAHHEDDSEEDEDEGQDTTDSDAELILQEIELMQSETDEILSLISKPKFARNRRVQHIRKQLIHLQRVNASLKARAESLLDIQ